MNNIEERARIARGQYIVAIILLALLVSPTALLLLVGANAYQRRIRARLIARRGGPPPIATFIDAFGTRGYRR